MAQADSSVSSFFEINDIMIPNRKGAMLMRSKYLVEFIVPLIR